MLKSVTKQPKVNETSEIEYYKQQAKQLQNQLIE